MDRAVALRIGDLLFRIRMDRKGPLFSFVNGYFEGFLAPGCSEGEVCDLSISFSEKGFKKRPLYRGEDSSLYYHPPGKAHLVIRKGEGFIPLYNALYLLTSFITLLKGGCLFHGAGLAYRGKGFLFIGPSGAGKTTITKLLHEAEVLSDEAVGLKVEGGRFRLFATPFGARSGEENRERLVGREVILSRIFCLEKDSVNSLEDVEFPFSMGPLLSNIPFLHLFKRHHMENLLSVLYRTARTVPIKVLRFRKDRAFLKGVLEDG